MASPYILKIPIIASNIHPEVEDMLNQAVEKYIKKKEHQKMKPITSDCENLLRKENEELCISKQVLEKKIEELLDLQEQYKSREVAMTRLELRTGQVGSGYLVNLNR